MHWQFIIESYGHDKSAGCRSLRQNSAGLGTPSRQSRGSSILDQNRRLEGKNLSATTLHCEKCFESFPIIRVHSNRCRIISIIESRPIGTKNLTMFKA